MGHLAGKDVFRRVGAKLDNGTVKAPWTEALHQVIREVFTEEDADVYVKMPYTFSTASRIARTTGYDPARLQPLLEGLCHKGLVMDFFLNDEYHYMPNPLIVGLFEHTMMRAGDTVDLKKCAGLFHEYLIHDGSVYGANFRNGEQVSFMRAFAHEEAADEGVEILDYESAIAIVERAETWALGICSCRHEKLHAGVKECDIPLQTCSSMGRYADYLIRNEMARAASKTEMLELIDRSKETGLVFAGDNVKNDIKGFCHCCGCCCNALAGVSRFGFPNALTTTNYIAGVNDAECNGCGKCSKACPIGAIKMIKVDEPGSKRKKKPQIDLDFCLGCGVCSLKCESGAMKLKNRKKRVIHPENAFERVILQSLESGTLQNQIFDDPESRTQEAMRTLVGAFLRLTPVKKALMSDTLRSTFLKTMEAGVKAQGKGYMLDI